MILNTSTHSYWTIGRYLGKGEWFLDTTGSFYATREKAAEVADKANVMLESYIASGEKAINPLAKYIPVRVESTRTLHDE